MNRLLIADCRLKIHSPVFQSSINNHQSEIINQP